MFKGLSTLFLHHGIASDIDDDENYTRTLLNIEYSMYLATMPLCSPCLSMYLVIKCLMLL